MHKPSEAQISATSNQIYDDAAEKFGTSNEAVLWSDQQTQYLRFAEIAKFIDVNNPNTTLLDVGCGNAELYRYLNFQGFRGKYSGCDINEKLIALSKQRFPDVDTYCYDITSGQRSEKFDYVVMSGLFNRDCGQDIGWIRNFIGKMFEAADSALIFNAISTYTTRQDPGMFYVNPVELFAFCLSTLSKRVTITHHNLPYNYSVCVYKNQNWNSVNG